MLSGFIVINLYNDDTRPVNLGCHIGACIQILGFVATVIGILVKVFA